MNSYRMIDDNGLNLTEAEREAAAACYARLQATTMSLYRSSDGLRAYVVDSGGGEHNGVPITNRTER